MSLARRRTCLHALDFNSFSFALRTRRGAYRCRILPSRCSTANRRAFWPVCRRSTSTVASSTAVNAPVAKIHPRLEDLHRALEEVKTNAPSNVGLSALQLALRGLQTPDPTVRIAILSLDKVTPALSLVRLLLADPLNPKAAWEDELEKWETGEGDLERSLLFRYGESTRWGLRPGIPTLHLPSDILQRHRLEILVSSVPEKGRKPPPESVLSTPTINIPSSDRIIPIQYPVHKTLVVSEGLSGLQVFVKLPRASLEKENGEDEVVTINLVQANRALDAFRKSLDNSSEYQYGWRESGISVLSDWMRNVGVVDAGQALKPVVRDLVTSLLNEASNRITAEDGTRLQEVASNSASEDVRLELNEAITSWSERAHAELRDTLGAGFAGKRWRRLAWWKLLWRVDDVAMNTEDILAHKWLPEAERGVVFLSGRLWQAGLVGDDGFTLRSTEDPDTAPDQENAPEDPPKISPPWPDVISSTRTELILNTIPPLQTLSQRLLFISLSTTFLTGSLSVLSYIAVSSTSAYEAGTVAALGLVYSLRRLQKKWEAAREFWKGEIREEARVALKKTESILRTVVRIGGRPRLDPREVEARAQARASIQKALDALENC